MNPAIAIHAWRPEWRHHFERLNLDWLQRYFSVEDIDREVLGAPERMILEPGGHIVFATAGDEVVGTGALRHAGDAVYELTKMAVDPAWQGRGVGRRLLETLISHYRGLGGRSLFLESNSTLAPALHLYQQLGFEHRGRKSDSHYARSDVHMVLREN